MPRREELGGPFAWGWQHTPFPSKEGKGVCTHCDLSRIVWGAPMHNAGWRMNAANASRQRQSLPRNYGP